MNWSNDNCPVCDKPAQEAVPRIGDLAEFICDDCGRYRITGTALKTIRSKDRQIRLALLEQAKSVATQGNEMPTITSSL